MFNRSGSALILLLFLGTIVGILAILVYHQIIVIPKDLTPEGLKKSVLGDCVRAGCNNELCLDSLDPKPTSTCKTTLESTCYAVAKCERQPGGRCGFTDTEGLRSCLSAMNDGSFPTP